MTKHKAFKKSINSEKNWNSYFIGLCSHCIQKGFFLQWKGFLMSAIAAVFKKCSNRCVHFGWNNPSRRKWPVRLFSRLERRLSWNTPRGTHTRTGAHTHLSLKPGSLLSYLQCRSLFCSVLVIWHSLRLLICVCFLLKQEALKIHTYIQVHHKAYFLGLTLSNIYNVF